MDAHRVNLDSSGFVRFSPAITNVSATAPYVAGGKMVFAKSSGTSVTLWIANADGSAQKSLGVQGNSPVLTPSGDVIFATGGTNSVIAKVNNQGKNKVTLVDIPGQHEGAPTVARTGNKLAFESGTPIGSGVFAGAENRRIYTATLAGGTITNVSPISTTGRWEDSDAALSPDGSRIVFTRQPRDRPYGGLGTPSVMRMTSNGASAITLPLIAFDYVWGHEWSPDGSRIAFTAGATTRPQYGNDVYSAPPDGTSVNRLTNAHGDEYAPGFLSNSALVFPFAVPTDEQLLDIFTPVMRYDSQETYRAGSAAMMSDNYLPTDPPGEHTNRLINQRVVMASADPASPEDTLSLNFLRPEWYANNAPASEYHNIDAFNEYASDAQRLQANPGYANKTYGRVVPASGGDTILQYWFFYYHNPKTYFTRGAHEGDWEMVQYRLDSVKRPVNATYSQHEGGETCSWPYVRQTTSGRPAVFPGEGSHASYFSPGDHEVIGDPSGVVSDGNDGGVPAVGLTIESNITSPPAWMRWPGAWGGSDNSPKSPPVGQGAKWSNPEAWAGSVNGCTENAPGQAARTSGTKRKAHLGAARPRIAASTPKLSARRKGNAVTVRYRVSARGRPWMLLTSVDPAGSRLAPLTKRTILKSRSGIVKQPLGRGVGPFRLAARIVDRKGNRSRRIVVPIRR